MKGLFHRAMQAVRRLSCRFRRAKEVCEGSPSHPATRFDDPKQFLLAVMRDEEVEPSLRLFAAKELMPLMHKKRGGTAPREEVK